MGGVLTKKRDSYNVGNGKSVSLNKTNRISSDINQFRRTELINDASAKSDVEIIGEITEIDNIKKDDVKTVRIDESKSVFFEHTEPTEKEPPKMSADERKIKEDVLMAIVRGEVPPETSLEIKKDESTKLAETDHPVIEKKASSSNDMDAITVIKDEIGERIRLIDESDSETDLNIPKNVQDELITVDVSKPEQNEDTSTMEVVEDTLKINNEEAVFLKIEVKKELDDVTEKIVEAEVTEKVKNELALSEENENQSQKRDSKESAKSASSEEDFTVTEEVIEVEVTALSKAEQAMGEVKEDPIQKQEVLLTNMVVNASEDAKNTNHSNVDQAINESIDKPVDVCESNESANLMKVTITKTVEEVALTAPCSIEQVMEDEPMQKRRSSISEKEKGVGTTGIVETVEITDQVVEEAKDNSIKELPSKESLGSIRNKDKDEVLYLILDIEKQTNRLKEQIINFSSTSKNEEYEALLETLIKNIIKLDDIAYIDDEVKNERKRVIKIIQQSIQNLEKKIEKDKDEKNNSDSE